MNRRTTKLATHGGLGIHSPSLAVPALWQRLAVALVMMLVAVIGTGCSNFNDNPVEPPLDPSELTDAEKAELLERAYVYALPLMLMDATYIKMTNVVEPVGQQAPANRLIHARRLANANTKEVVTPNVDTNYTQVMMDLSGDALVLRLPHTDRFCLAQILDAWSNCIAAPMATDIEGDYGYYCFTGPNFKGTVPDGMVHIASPTDHVWMLLRTVCMGEDDLPNVHAIQDEMRTYLLSDFLASGTEYTGKGSYDAAYDFPAPVDYIMTMPMADFFTRANELMLTNPPAAADAEWLADLKRINVGPGLTFDATVFSDQAQHHRHHYATQSGVRQTQRLMAVLWRAHRRVRHRVLLPCSHRCGSPCRQPRQCGCLSSCQRRFRGSSSQRQSPLPPAHRTRQLARHQCLRILERYPLWRG